MADQPHANEGDNSQGSGAPEALTMEDVNKAISARLASFGKKLTGDLGESFKAQLAELTETLKQPPKPAETGAEGKETPEMNAMKRQLEEYKRVAENTAASLKAERERGREAALRERVLGALSEHGFSDANGARMALTQLLASKRVSYESDDSDSVVFKDQEFGDTTLADGIKSWAKGSEAKFFLPASASGGSGDRGSNSGGVPQSNDPQKQLADSVMGMLTRMSGGG